MLRARDWDDHLGKVWFEKFDTFASRFLSEENLCCLRDFFMRKFDLGFNNSKFSIQRFNDIWLKFKVVITAIKLHRPLL